MKSFAEWTAVGRAVRKGEKARYRRVNEDRTQSVPLFEEDQTEELQDIGTDWEVITEDAWKELKGITSQPKVKLRQHGVAVLVWCGNNKQAIKMLQKAGYFYDMKTHRWSTTRKTLAEIAKGFEFKGFRVEVEDE